MNIQFTKMEGAGNDFIVLDARHEPIELQPALIQRLADRRIGIGCDQVLVVQSPRNADNTLAYRIFNADGQEVQQCGNGARALGAYAASTFAHDSTEIRMESMVGLIVAKLVDENHVSVNMGEPNFSPASLPFNAPTQASEYVLDIEGHCIEFGAVSMGNPHVVIPVNNVDSAPVELWGQLLQSHAAFPESVNVGFMQILNSKEMRLRVYERGVGETLACGTGACAAAAVAQNLGLVGSRVQIHARGGNLLVSWDVDGQNVWLTGACNRVFEGTINI